MISLVALSVSLSAQAPTLETLLDRLGTYLRDYETQLSSIVADERMDQKFVRLRTERIELGRSVRVTRSLESEVSFVRLPGHREWLGFREVRKVNGETLRTEGQRLGDLLQNGGDVLVQAKAIAAAGAAHNLGLPRTINVPTAVLEILDPAHRARFRFSLAGTATIRRIPLAVIAFEETGRPTVVRQPDGGNIVSSGRVWIEPASGRVSRVEWLYDSEPPDPHLPVRPKLTVEFGPHAALEMMVPTRMEEVFGVPYGTGDGTATYRNFRRFQTSARIVPQP